MFFFPGKFQFTFLLLSVFGLLVFVKHEKDPPIQDHFKLNSFFFSKK